MEVENLGQGKQKITIIRNSAKYSLPKLIEKEVMGRLADYYEQFFFEIYGLERDKFEESDTQFNHVLMHMIEDALNYRKIRNSLYNIKDVVLEEMEWHKKFDKK